MKRSVICLATVATLLLPIATIAFAADPNTGGSTGQPSQTCQNFPTYPEVTPGNSFNAPGSAFNPNGQAGSVYAGTQPQTSKNHRYVSQYDDLCYQHWPSNVEDYS